MNKTDKLQDDLVYRYTRNGLRICGRCANDRTYPENVECYPARMKGRAADCEYCAGPNKTYATEPPAASDQIEYQPLTSEEYSDLMTALSVACGERSPLDPLTHTQVITIRQLWYKLATKDMYVADHYFSVRQEPYNALVRANDETVAALVPAPNSVYLETAVEYETFIARLYNLPMTYVYTQGPWYGSQGYREVHAHYGTYMVQFMVSSYGICAVKSIESFTIV